MKALKRWGVTLATMLALTLVLTGTALAAEPAGISVQLNGKPLAFTDAAPEITSDRTFLPFRAVLEALGAEVGYDAETSTVSAKRDGVDLAMVLGQNTASVTEGGQTRTVEMDVTPYVKNGRTYVPVRFVAETFGCNVGWDGDDRTVIIADVDALLGDATFELMDNFSAYCTKQQKSKTMTMTGALTLDITDKTGGNTVKPISAKGSIDGVTSDKGMQVNWDLSLSDPSEALGLPQGIAAALSNLKGEVRMDMESGMLYLSVPGVITGGEKDTWYSMDFGAYETQLLGSMNVTQLTQMEEAGIREVLAAVVQAMPLDDSQTSYETLAQVAKVYVDMLSDQAFTQKGNTYVAEMKVMDVMDMTVTLTKRGNDIVAADIKASGNADENGEKVSFTMTEHAAPDKVTVEMEMSMDISDMSIKLGLDLNSVPTAKVPVTTLPAGVQAVPMG